jgi:hypothetical protein
MALGRKQQEGIKLSNQRSTPQETEGSIQMATNEYYIFIALPQVALRICVQPGFQTPCEVNVRDSHAMI